MSGLTADIQGGGPVLTLIPNHKWSQSYRPILLVVIFTLLSPMRVSAQDPGERGAGAGTSSIVRQVPEALKFANGLFRERRYEMAADEYERFLKAAKPGPDADEARFGLANARLFQGRYDQAKRLFEDFLKAAPQHPSAATARYRVGETAYMIGDLPLARQALETFTAENPDHRHLETAWPYLGDVYLRLGDLPRARKAYDEALASYPEGRLADRARFGLGRTLALQGDSEAALKVFNVLVERGGPEWIDRSWLQIGQILAGSGQFAKAIEAFETLEKLAPRGQLVAESRLNRAEALLQLDRRDESVPILRALAKEGPTTVATQAAFSLGTSQLASGQPAEALATLDEALKRSSKSPITTALLFRSAEAQLKLGQVADARARFLKAAEADPSDPWADDAWLRAARLALDTGDREGACRLADDFAARFPASPLRADARLIEGRAALAEKRAKEAITILTAALADDKPGPDTARSLTYYLGQAYRADGQSAKGAEMFDTLAKTPAAPVAVDAQYMIGQGHIEARRFAEAIPAFAKYLDGKPDGEVADYALAHLVQAHLELGQPDAAEESLARLADRFPASKALPPTRLRMAEAALGAKRRRRAIELFRLVAAGDDPSLSARARSGLGWALLEEGEPAEAAAAFADLLAAAPDDRLAPDAALGRARALDLAKKPDEAIAAHSHVMTRYSGTEQADQAALGRARLLVEARLPDEAAQAFSDYIRDHPDPKTVAGGVGLDALLGEWGWALIDAGKTDESDRVFTRLLKEFPDSPHAADARFNLAESAYQARHHEEVVNLLGPLVAPESKVPPKLIQSALYRLGRTQAVKKDWAGASRSFDRLITEYPDNPYQREARFWRAEVAFQGDDLATAEIGFAALASEPVAASDPDGFLLTIRRRRIQSLVGLKRWADTISAAEAYRADAPEDPLLAEVDYARGRALQAVARFDEARDAYQAVIDARKGGDLAARSQLMRGETYFHQKNYHDAKLEFYKVELLYDAPIWQATALLELGKVYERLFQWTDAAETYERLRAKFPEDPNAAEARSLLEGVRKRLASQDDSARTANANHP
jgi:cellulose synthase operon protein C